MPASWRILRRSGERTLAASLLVAAACSGVVEPEPAAGTPVTIVLSTSPVSVEQGRVATLEVRYQPAGVIRAVVVEGLPSGVQLDCALTTCFAAGRVQVDQLSGTAEIPLHADIGAEARTSQFRLRASTATGRAVDTTVSVRVVATGYSIVPDPIELRVRPGEPAELIAIRLPRSAFYLLPIDVRVASAPAGLLVHGQERGIPLGGYPEGAREANWELQIAAAPTQSLGEFAIDLVGTSGQPGFPPPTASIRLVVVPTEPVSANASIASGGNFSCGLTSDGAARCWGQLNFRERITTGTSVPIGGGFVLDTLVAGKAHACALASGGETVCWGWNVDGELGNGAYSESGLYLGETLPVTVVGGLRFSQITAGGAHTCGLTVSGAAYCWGRNDSGELGVAAMPRATSPVRVSGGLTFASIHAGLQHTCGVTLDGMAYCWGGNLFGALGDGTRIGRSAPAPVAGGLRFASLSGGEFHTCGLLDDGRAYCWGLNSAYELGISSDVLEDVVLTPTPTWGALRFSRISAGAHHTCALTTSGTVACWGVNRYGPVGDGTVFSRAEPVAVLGGLRFNGVSSGSQHTCAIAVDGSAFCWGFNLFGQVGDGTTGTGRFVPTRVAGGHVFR